MLKYPSKNFVFLETNRFDGENHSSYLFVKPVKIVAAYKLEEVFKSLSEIEDATSRGYYAAGFISYEAGFAFEESLSDLFKPSGRPLVWFGIYKKPILVKNSRAKRERGSFYKIKNLRPNISLKRYLRDISRIKECIRKGDTYQVNYTFKYKFRLSGKVESFYNTLKQKQTVSYSALIKTDDFSVLSLSPELFFRKKGRSVKVKPMKGTMKRGMDRRGDSINEEGLRNSLKDRSENVMIVDLLRNDLGRISESGSVKAESLFEVERYETLLQMISVIKSRLKKDTRLFDLLEAIFPSGSVTGAPKISTMRIINSLEKEPRDIYTGSIGYLSPEGDGVFNVAIRTILIDNKTSNAEMGIGSGIVYDSEPRKEFDECRLKAEFMISEKKDFKLLETMLYRRKRGYFLSDFHIKRLLSSADYFGFKINEKNIEKRLDALKKKFKKNTDYKVRLLLSDWGSIDIKYSRLKKHHKTGLKVKFSKKKLSSRNVFLYHKTTNRDFYDKEYGRWSKKGYFDVIFTNEKNQITEGAISNIIIKKKGVYYTPPVECGLLNGTYRSYLLKSGRLPLKEKLLYKSDLKKADKIYAINSVRGMVEVEL